VRTTPDDLVIAIVPARSGSKGLRDKNTRPFAGRSLLEYAIGTCKEAGIFARIVVSTDSSEIAARAVEAGGDVPFLRPAELAKDDTPILDVLVDTTLRLEQQGTRPTIIALIEPTSPMRTASHIVRAVSTLIESGANSVVCVSPIPGQHHPDKAMQIDDRGNLQFFSSEGQGITHRQQLKGQMYYRNGAAYVVRRDTLIEQRSLYGPPCLPIVVDGPFISIDTMEDFEIAEMLVFRVRGDDKKRTPAEQS
jgi:CMP-N,N'-diacetyllegionaminic acid synthase